jgi:cyclic-di-GMP-binding protein
MSAIFQRMAKALPERHAPGKSSFATESKALREWIDHLPLANPAATGRLLLNALREMNQLRLDPAQRGAALEALRGPTTQVIVSMDRTINADTFPLPAAKQQLGQQISDFDREMALGYTALVHDICAPAGAVPFLRGKAVTLALVRAIQHYGALLYRAYVLYLSPPPGVWQMLHDLFRFAVAVRLDEKPVANPLNAGAEISVRGAYMHALLYALSNPYRFTQRENGEIYQLTRLLSAYCELRPGRAPEGAIAVQVESDIGPGYLPEEREVPVDGVWAFQTSALSRFVEGEVAALGPGEDSVMLRPKGAQPIRVELPLVEKLAQGWAGTAGRGHTRLPAGHRLDCVIGLQAIHYVLCENMDFDAFLRSIRGVAISLREGDRIAAWTASPTADALRLVRHSVKVLDQSLSGYRLQWDKLDGVRVKVGELLALAPPAEDGDMQDWMIGSIRWLRFHSADAMEAGVELLSRRALPVGLRSFDGDGAPRAPMRGLLLDPLAGDVGMAAHTILAPHLFDRAATEVELMRAADPFAAVPEPTVENLSHLRVIERGGYLQIVLESSAAAEAREDAATSDAANDDLTLAAASDS